MEAGGIDGVETTELGTINIRFCHSVHKSDAWNAGQCRPVESGQQRNELNGVRGIARARRGGGGIGALDAGVLVVVDVVDLVVGTEDGEEAVSSGLGGDERVASALGRGDEGDECNGGDETQETRKTREERRPNDGPGGARRCGHWQKGRGGTQRKGR